MTDQGTKKKLTRVGGDETPDGITPKETKPFEPSVLSKSRARMLRLIAVIAWIVAIGFQIWAIVLLKKPPISTTWLIVLIVADLICVGAGSLLWKKANRLDPASKQDKFRFFVQNQLGAIMSIIAFLPLVILIFTNKNLSGKQKGLVGTIAVVAMVVAGLVGIDLNPPSVEEYTEQTEQVETLNEGVNHVYWTKSGKSFHLYSDCSYINTDRTDEIFEGTVAQAREMKKISDLCDRCENKAMKAKEEKMQQEALPEPEPEQE